MTSILILVPVALSARPIVSTPDSIAEWELDEFVVEKKKVGNMKLSGPENAFRINQTELFRAACCNLGESFTTNPSVDVNYSDPGTGAKQIKLLGLSGSYVQLLSENMPDFRGAARPYALRYVPGPWMKSISVSKGSASVKNGFEAM
ncbi:MAG: Plug domain-containing protein [Muribaculaceae bacterium]|nr:Plug domain-containing protein [Muribaculaceae bacterium]